MEENFETFFSNNSTSQKAGELIKKMKVVPFSDMNLEDKEASTLYMCAVFKKKLDAPKLAQTPGSSRVINKSKQQLKIIDIKSE